MEVDFLPEVRMFPLAYWDLLKTLLISLKRPRRNRGWDDSRHRYTTAFP